MRAIVPHTLKRESFDECEGYEQPHIVHWSGSLERRCKRGGGYRMRAKSFRLGISRAVVFLQGETKRMKKITLLLLTVLGVFMSAVPALAQPESAAAAANNTVGLKALAAGIGFAIAVVGGALGQARIGAAACEGAARNPGAAAKIQTMMILGLALIESLVLFALVIVFIKT
jgi:F-type H+-transporting ATPase subunit c